MKTSSRSVGCYVVVVGGGGGGVVVRCSSFRFCSSNESRSSRFVMVVGRWRDVGDGDE